MNQQILMIKVKNIEFVYLKKKWDEIKKTSSAGFEPARASPTDF